MMPKETKIKCDKCKKEITDGYQQRYMIVLKIGYPHYYNDGGSFAACDRESQKFYLHFDCSKPIFDACPQIIPEPMKQESR